MVHIFVAGAYFTTNKNDTDMYPFITNILKRKFPSLNIIMPTDIEKYRENFINQNPNASIKQINKAMVDYDLLLVKTAKMLVVDVSNKSTGLGIELGTIVNDNKPLIFIAKEGSKISNMVYGAFPEIEVNFYSNKEDLEKIIENIKL
ncbi:MAG: hypothetical protein IJB98_00185 [Clostridia bacterium]|nr:hypothetical protein [Clostridia bacterium]